ncbi:MAG: DUF4364 family protein, partial [Christensenellaceae bacterium]
LLYLLDRSNMGLSELQIVRIMDELGLLSYFDLKECIFELEQNNHIIANPTPQTLLYSISEKGSAMLNVLVEDLRLSFRTSIDEYLQKNKSELEKESQLIGEFIKLSENEYRVTLKVLEQNRTVFEINLIVYSKTQAQQMVEQWRSKAVSLYQELFMQLS